MQVPGEISVQAHDDSLAEEGGYEESVRVYSLEPPRRGEAGEHGIGLNQGR